MSESSGGQHTRVVVDGLSVRLDTSPIVSDANLTFGVGELVGIVGPNGSGKSTLLRTIYRALRPLSGAVQADIKTEVTARRAVTGTVDWTVNGSRAQGAKMVKDLSTLMLRAYNADADNCVRTVKPHTLHSARQRLDRTRTTIAKLGRTMSIAIAERYHRMRIHEIELTADYLAKVETERELVRAQNEAAREEERARREFEREKQKLLKEQAHYLAAYDRLRNQPSADPAPVAELRAQLDRLGADIATVDAPPRTSAPATSTSSATSAPSATTLSRSA